VQTGVHVHSAVGGSSKDGVGPAGGADHEVGDAVEVHGTGAARGADKWVALVFAVARKEETAVLAGDDRQPASGSGTRTEVEVVPLVGTYHEVGDAVKVHVGLAYRVSEIGTGLFVLVGEHEATIFAGVHVHPAMGASSKDGI